MLNRHLLLGGVCAALVGAGAYLTTQSRALGLCLGACDEARKEEFIGFTYAWMQNTAYCGRSSAADALMSELFPKKFSEIRALSDDYAVLAEKERNGTLTLGERESYMDSQYKAPERSLMLQVIDPIEEPLIRPCSTSGFRIARGWDDLDGYCYGYAYFHFPRHPLEGSMGEFMNLAYKEVRTSGDVEAFISRAKSEVRRHQEALYAARQDVADMPASNFTVDNPAEMRREVASRVMSIACQN